MFKVTDTVTEPLGLSKKDIPLFEMEVKIININEGRNKEIVKKCETLAQYSVFIAKVNEFKKKGFSLVESIKEAVNYCRDHDILKEFLEEHAKEVTNMLITEWNWDKEKEVARKEGREEGRKEFVRNALAKGLSYDIIHDITGLSPEVIKELSAT